MERRALNLEPGPEEIREASMRLPERQREALVLRALEQRSYEEIATIMETSPDSVPQLIARARINLYDELRGTVLASVAAPSPDCERALPLIAARDDGQLEAGSGDAIWLDAHLAECDRCRLGEEQMGEADVSYRSLAPIAAASGESLSGTPPAPRPAQSRFRLPRGRAALAGGLAALLLLGGVAAALVMSDGAPAPAGQAADSAFRRGTGERVAAAKSARAGSEKRGAAKEKTKTPATESGGAAATDTTSSPVTVPVQATTGGGASGGHPSGPNRFSGKTGVEPTKQTSPPKPASKPKPAPTATPTSQPASGPAPATETPTTTEEPADGPGRSDEAPGKPAGHPSH
jgi:hypothetical protein